MRILGVDPGYATIGYGIVDYLRGQFQPVEFGAITTPPKEPFPQRLEEIYDGIEYLIQKHRPEVMAVEELFFAKNQTTIIGVGQARGAILLAAQKGKLPVFEYTPMQVKLAIVGYGSAVKGQVMDMTRRMLHLREVPKPDDAADALAIAMTHAHVAGSKLGAVNTLQAQLDKYKEKPSGRYQQLIEAALEKERQQKERGGKV